MARGFLSGAIWGTLLSLGVAGVTSVYVGAPVAPQVGDAAPGGVVAPAPLAEGQDAPGNDSDLVQDSGSQVTQPAADTVTAAAEAGADVPTQPQAGGADGLQTPSAPATDGSVSVDTVAPVLPSPQAVGPTQPEGEAELSISTDPAQPPAPTVPEGEGAFETVVVVPEPTVPEPTAQAPAPASPEQQAEQQTDQQTEQQTEQQTDAPSGPTIGRPAGSLVDRDNGQTAETSGAPEATDPTDPVKPAAIAPIDAFATPFTPEGERPLMAIVLIDTGDAVSSDAVGVAALRSFPAPITFAVPASLPDAAERMAQYRAQGFEVLAMIDLPDAATAADAEVNLNAVLSTMKEVVGVIEGVGTGLQQGREASDQITQILQQSGHGLVTQSKGLNTMEKLALREGVPAASVFRDFDSADQTPTVIRRFLDQAAFRADQEGGVIMLGRLRADTISALLLWGLADRAERVSLAPVSAVLKQRVLP